VSEPDDVTSIALAEPASRPLSGELTSAVESLRRDAVPPNTARAYASARKLFVRWCEAEGQVPLPASADTLEAYVAHLEQAGARVSSIRVAMSGIHAGHVKMRAQSARHDDRVQKAIRAVARRQADIPPRQRAAITPDILRKIVAALPDRLLGVRDRAAILVCWATAMRRSELVSLRVEHFKWAPEGVTVTVRRGESGAGTKTDQEGRGRVVALYPSKEEALCPVRSLERWLRESGITSGPVFREVNRHGQVGATALKGDTFRRVVRRACSQAGIDEQPFGAHSLRAGLITTAAKAGRSLDEIARTSGHKDINTLRLYIRDVEALSNGVAKGLLDE
jgi:integrase